MRIRSGKLQFLILRWEVSMMRAWSGLSRIVSSGGIMECSGSKSGLLEWGMGMLGRMYIRMARILLKGLMSRRILRGIVAAREFGFEHISSLMTEFKRDR